MSYSPPKYPASIPDQVTDLPDRTDDIDWIEAWIYNYVKKELVAVMTELGADPAGTEATVAARLTAIEAAGVDESVIMNIYLNSFRIAILGSYAVMNMAKGISDEYEDESGIDTTASTEEVYDSANDLYSPTTGADRATGGTITYDGDYVIHTFTGNGTFTPDAAFNVECLLVAGGGAGRGNGDQNSGDGGDAGDLIYDSEHAVTAKAYSIVVGAAGVGVARDVGGNGGDSTFDDKTADGGIGGQVADGAAARDGGDGAGASGQEGAGSQAGAGGVGLAYSISGAEVYYAGGGGGGYTAGGLGGNGGGGRGEDYGVGNAAAGTVNTGGGGGGVSSTGDNAGKNGGSGIVIIKYAKSTSNMTLISEKFTADAEADDARIIIFEEDVDATTLNTDIKAYVSRDDGTTWTQITLTDEGDYSGSKRILSGTADISGQPSGTDMVYKITSLNNKDLKIHGSALSWA